MTLNSYRAAKVARYWWKVKTGNKETSMFDSVATYPSKLCATYTKWGNLYRARFYIDGKRVSEWLFTAKVNALTKHDAGYTRTMQDDPKIVGYRIIWTRG